MPSNKGTTDHDNSTMISGFNYVSKWHFTVNGCVIFRGPLAFLVAGAQMIDCHRQHAQIIKTKADTGLTYLLSHKFYFLLHFIASFGAFTGYTNHIFTIFQAIRLRLKSTENLTLKCARTSVSVLLCDRLMERR